MTLNTKNLINHICGLPTMVTGTMVIIDSPYFQGWILAFLLIFGWSWYLADFIYFIPEPKIVE